MKRLCFMVVVLLLVSVLGCTKAGEKVLLIFSYHPEYSWVIEETRGVEEVFKDKGIVELLESPIEGKFVWKRQIAHLLG